MRDRVRRGQRDTGRSDYGPPHVGADGWTTSVTRPPQTGLSTFGKIERTSAGLQFGPTSVFSKRGEKREYASVTRISSSSNMFTMLNSSFAEPDAVFSTAATSDYGEEETASNAGAAASSMTLERAKLKINEDVKGIFILKDLTEGESYFESLPPDFRNELIETLFHKAIDAKESETQPVIELFGCAASKGLATESQFEKGFECDMEFLEDISVDVPQVYTTVAKLMRAAKLSKSVVERCVHNLIVSYPSCWTNRFFRLTDKIAVEGDMAVKPKNKLLKIHASLA